MPDCRTQVLSVVSGPNSSASCSSHCAHSSPNKLLFFASTVKRSFCVNGVFGSITMLKSLAVLESWTKCSKRSVGRRSQTSASTLSKELVSYRELRASSLVSGQSFWLIPKISEPACYRQAKREDKPYVLEMARGDA